MLYAISDVADYLAAADGSLSLPTAPLYRCTRLLAPNQHFISAKPDCEGEHVESTIGYMALRPGLEMLRALYRCLSVTPNVTTHSLDLPCDIPDRTAAMPLGYVR